MLTRLITGALIVCSTILISSGTGVGQSPTMKATPSSLSFVAAQGGQLASQTLEITDTGAGTAAFPWTALPDAAWLTLNLTSGTGKTSLTATANPSGLAAGVYQSKITLTGTGAAAGQTVTVAATLTVTAPPIPPSANLEWKNRCVDKSLNINGDFQKGFFGYGGGNWSVGPAVSTQLIKYDFAKKQAGFNTSVGAGASFRYYKDITVKDQTGKPDEQAVKIS